MFWMKASDKTIATNASVNGFGASKRIIIWDTTLAQESDDEVLADFGLDQEQIDRLVKNGVISVFEP